MRNCAKAIELLLALALLAVAAPPFQILTTHLPQPRQGENYTARLRAIGGTTPYTWRIAHGALPAGLHLNAHTGEISGLPRSNQPFQVLIAVTDSGQPPLEETRLLPSGATAPLALQWTQAPAVSGETLTGAVAVRNNSGQTARLTVIVVAVAESNHKAFTLRYAHPTLTGTQSTGALPFSVFLPPGTYTVHVDAVAEISQGVIYRQRLEVPGLKVPGS